MSTVVSAMAGDSNFGTSVTRSLGFTCTIGNTIVIIVRCTQTVTLTGDFASATLDDTSTGQSGIAISIYSLKNISTASTTLTMTLGAATTANCQVIELQGDNDYVTGSLVRNTVTPGTSLTATLTDTAAGQCAIAFNDASNSRTSVSLSGDVTNLLTNGWLYGMYLASTAGDGTVDCGLTWTGSVNSATVAVLYEESGGSPPVLAAVPAAQRNRRSRGRYM